MVAGHFAVLTCSSRFTAFGLMSLKQVLRVHRSESAKRPLRSVQAGLPFGLEPRKGAGHLT